VPIGINLRLQYGSGELTPDILNGAILSARFGIDATCQHYRGAEGT
jgi:hypothetical protein